MDPRDILRQAQAALERGDYTVADIDATLASRPEVPFTSFAELQKAVATEDALLRINERGGSAVGDFGRMAAQGLTFGFADELAGLGAMLPGGRTPSEAIAKSRQRVEDLRLTSPVVSALSELAGGFLLPGAGITSGLARSGARQAAARGAAAGGAQGLLTGIGEAEGGLRGRARGGAIGATIGTAAGGILTPIIDPLVAGTGSLISRATSRGGRGQGQRLGNVLQREARVNADINDALRVNREGLDAVSENLFKPLDDRFPVVDNPAVSRFLGELTDNKDIRTVVPRSLRDGDRLPSFNDLQRIRSKLFGRGRGDDAEEMTEIMTEVFGETFTEANADWGRLRGIERQLLAGEKSMSMGANQLERAIENLSETERMAFLQGRLSEIVQRGGQRGARATGPLRNMLDAGPSTERAMSVLFRDKAAQQRFVNAVRTEQAGDVILDVLTAGLKITLGGGALGAGFEGVQRLTGN